MKKTFYILLISITSYAIAQTPAGNNGEIQYNSNGSFGASQYLKASSSQLSLLDIGSTSAKIFFQSESGDNSYIFSENYGVNSNRLVFLTRDDGENDYSVFRNLHWNHGAKDVFEIHRSWTKANSNFYVTDNLGIGTTSTSSKLHIKSDNYQDFIVLDRKGRPEMDNLVYLTPSWDSDKNDQLRFLIGNQIIAAFEETGNVGIGTHNPTERLDVVGSVKVNHSKPEGLRLLHSSATQGQWQAIGSNVDGDLILSAHGTIDGNEHLLIEQNTGNVGIGTTNTFGYKLAVNGTIGSTEVKVENTSAWPDFVFENDYKLPSLDEVEKFITKNNHLPEIPSEAEVLEEGINLGEMNAKLLQKIEELTLYLIEQNKEIKELKKEVNLLKAK